MTYDIAVIGSGPGGYVAAIRAAQLNQKVVVIERAEIGGICLNWGCIPTKALLKSANVFKTVKEAKKFGIESSGADFSFDKIIKRSRTISGQMSKGVKFLFDKNKIEVVQGFGKLKDSTTISIEGNSDIQEIKAKNIILATGARSRQLPNLPIDGKKIIGYREALTLEKQPSSMLVVGSGAIGAEFAYFYGTLGTKVTVVELLDRIVPLEDEDVSAEVAGGFKKARIKVLTSSMVQNVDTSGENCVTTIKTDDGEIKVESEIVLSAVGISPNTENLGLEELGINVTRNFVDVNEFYQTNVPNIYAIGDIIATPALAHVASKEGIVCVEKIAGHDVEAVNYNQIPGGIFTEPEVGSVGMSEAKAIEAGYEVKIGKFPMSALGKATAIGERGGFVKLVFNKKDDKLLGAHIVGHSATDMISELVLNMKNEGTSKDIMNAVHPHPTTAEAIMEAAADANEEAIHI